MTADRAIKEPCRVASTANIASLSGLLTVDSVTLSAGDRVLVKNQTSSVNNGIYDAASGAWTRSTDFDGAGDVVGGIVVAVTSGTVGARSAWRVIGNGALTVGSSAMDFEPAWESGSVAVLQSGASAVTVEEYLAEFASDLGFSTLQAAVTAAAGRHLYVSRDWTLTAAVTVPADTVVEIGPGAVITQTTSATSIFEVTTDQVQIIGQGKLVGTNSETATSALVEVVGGDNFVLSGPVFQSGRFGVSIGTGCLNYRIEGCRFYGGAHDGVNSSDIFVIGNTGSPSRRGIIAGNFCLSNNDLGIYVNGNDGDREVLIANNIVCPLDTDGKTRLADANVWRRNGIAVSYAGATESVRNVSGNLIIGVAYSGFYSNSAARPVGSLNLTGNVIMESGFGGNYDATDASLRSGALFINPGKVNAHANHCVNCYTNGLKIVDSVGYGDIDAGRGVFQWFVENTRDATNVTTHARGVYLEGLPSGLDLDLYVIHGEDATEAAIAIACTGTDCGDIRIGGRVEVSNNLGALQLSASSSGTDIAHPIVVDGMNLHGTSKSDGVFNSGVWFIGNVQLRNLTIKTFDRGVNYGGTNNSRRLDLVTQNVFVEDCDFGFTGGGTGLILAEGAGFKNVGTEVNGCYVSGTLRTDETGIQTVRFSGSATPGTSYSGLTTAFARGDICDNSQPATGGTPIGWMRTASAWVALANL